MRGPRADHLAPPLDGEVLHVGLQRLCVLAFYQKAGFRVWRIERDFFGAARGYPEDI